MPKSGESPKTGPAARAGDIGELTPENTQFAVLSFEGPDEYSAAGGLGVRVRDLCQALAAQGFVAHLFFIGGPERPGVEKNAAYTSIAGPSRSPATPLRASTTRRSARSTT